MTTLRLRLSVVALVALAAGPADAVLKTVALQGDPSPDAAAPYKRFRAPAVSDAAGERVAFWVPTQGGRKCIFRVDPDGGPGTTVVCEKTPSPDGRLFTKLQDPSLDAAGTPVFASRTSVGNDGVYRGVPPAVVALTNDPVGPVFLDDPSYATVTDAGDVVFLARLTGGVPDDAALFRCAGGDGNCSPATAPPGTGTLTTLARVGDPVPDRPGREICAFLAADASNFGAAFTATTRLDCGDGGEPPLVGLFRRPFAGAVETIALAGEPSGVGPTTWANVRGTPSIANGGRVGFQADLTGTPSSGLFVCDAGTCPALPPQNALEVGQIDGAGNAFRFFSAPSVSDAGDLAFNARIGGGPAGASNGVYVWRAATDTVDAVALKGDAVPGIPGAVFRQFLLGPPAMSPGGRIVFKARIKRPTPPRNRLGIFIDE